MLRRSPFRCWMESMRNNKYKMACCPYKNGRVVIFYIQKNKTAGTCVTIFRTKIKKTLHM